jgi:hypothetical protein
LYDSSCRRRRRRRRRSFVVSKRRAKGRRLLVNRRGAHRDFVVSRFSSLPFCCHVRNRGCSFSLRRLLPDNSYCNTIIRRFTDSAYKVALFKGFNDYSLRKLLLFSREIFVVVHEGSSCSIAKINYDRAPASSVHTASIEITALCYCMN